MFPGGILVITSPYTWLEQYTPKVDEGRDRGRKERERWKEFRDTSTFISFSPFFTSFPSFSSSSPSSSSSSSPSSSSSSSSIQSKWIGGYRDDQNRSDVKGFQSLERIFGPNFKLVEDLDMPFLIRETSREHQWTVAHASVWRRKDK